MKTIFFTFLFLIIFRSEALSPERISIKTECSSEKSIEKQAYIKWKDLEIMLIDIKDAEKEDYFSASLISPYFGFGKLKTSGFFNEIQNPCGYIPGSGVFYDKAEIRIDKTLSRSGKSGFYVSPFPGLRCFGIKSESGMPEIIDPNILGSIFTFDISENFHSDILFIASAEEKNSSEDWYFKDASGFEREIFNTGGNFIFQHDFFAVSAAGGLSYGKYTETGFFARFSGSAFFKNYAVLTLLFSGSSENYLVPNGKHPLSKYKYGIDFLFTPFKFLSAEGEYYIDFQHPDYEDILYNDFSDNLSAKISFTPADLRLSASYLCSNKFSNSGIFTKSEKYSISAGYSGGSSRFSISDSFYFENTIYMKNSFTLSGKLNIGKFRLEASWKKDNDTKISDTFSEKITLDLEFFKFYASHKKEDETPHIVTFGAVFEY